MGSQEKLYAPMHKTSEIVRSIGDMVTGEIERSLELTSTSTTALTTTSTALTTAPTSTPTPTSSYINFQASEFMRQAYSPISRPSSTENSLNSVINSVLTTVQTRPAEASSSSVLSVATTSTSEETDGVEGLAASLRDSLRNPTEEAPESDDPPAKRRRSNAAEPSPDQQAKKANTHANGRTKSAAISTDWWRLPRRKWTSGAAALKAARRERNRSPLRQVKNALRSATRPNPTTRRGKSAKKRRSAIDRQSETRTAQTSRARTRRRRRRRKMRRKKKKT